MKSWYRSKTLWTNFLAAVGFFVSTQFGVEIPADAAVVFLAVINAILRAITKEGLAV